MCFKLKEAGGGLVERERVRQFLLRESGGNIEGSHQQHGGLWVDLGRDEGAAGDQSRWAWKQRLQRGKRVVEKTQFFKISGREVISMLAGSGSNEELSTLGQ